MNYEPKLDTHAAGFVWIESSLFTAENREVLVGLQTGSPFLIGQYKTCFWCEWWVWAVGAVKNFAEAHNSLGWMYENGRGVPQSDKKAALLYYYAVTSKATPYASGRSVLRCSCVGLEVNEIGKGNTERYPRSSHFHTPSLIVPRRAPLLSVPRLYQTPRR